MQHMIDYKKINKEISQHKRDRVHNNYVDESTCYYCPGSGHDLCTHPDHCVLNKEFQFLKGKIRWEYDYVHKLEQIYNDAVELKEEFPDKSYDELFVGFSPKSNRVRRAVVMKNIKRSYKELNELKTKKGGF